MSFALAPRQRAAVLLAAALLLGAAACGGAPSTSAPGPPPPSRTPVTTSIGTATIPTPGPRRLDVLETGLGSYLETTFPVAVLRSASTTETARGVTVHLSVRRSGAVVGATDVSLGTVGAGATVVVAGRVAGADRGLTVEATVAVASWDSAPPPHLVAVTAAPTCRGCGNGGSGDVVVTVSGDTDAVATMRVGAICRNAAGAPVGAGYAVKGGGRPPVALHVPLILSGPAVRCDATASAGAF